MLFLAAYNLRKKFSFLPLGSAERWLQAHLYVGVLSLVMLGIHLGARPPASPFGWALTLVYLIVFVSGVGGLALSRLMPKRLTARGGEVLFDRIPAAKRQLREEADAVVLRAVTASGSRILADFYLARLKDFFEGPSPYWSLLAGDKARINALIIETEDLHRYLGAQEREHLEQLTRLMRQRDDLDYHHAVQFILKAWLFIHVPFTYSLLILVLAHIAIVHAFFKGGS